MNDNKKNNIKYIIINVLIIITTIFLCTYEFPYYIDGPGGLDNLNNKIEVDNAYKPEGSFNLTYVSEYKATLPMLIISKFIKDWKIEPKDNANVGTLDYEESMTREKILMKQSYTTSIMYAYKKADKDIKILKENLYITYVLDGAITDLKVGDQIVSVDNKKINSYQEFTKLINNQKSNETISIEVLNNGEHYTKIATKVKIDNRELLGISLGVEYELETNPKYKFTYNNREFGPSGGLMIALAVYNSLVPTDITGGKVVAGTGTLDENGNVGPIGGIEYKIKGAVKNKADIFLAPAEENYDEAVKIKEKNNYDIEIVKISKFDDALDYLINNVVKK